MYRIIKKELNKEAYASFFNNIVYTSMDHSLLRDIEINFTGFYDKQNKCEEERISFDFRQFIYDPLCFIEAEGKKIFQTIIQYLGFVPQNELFIEFDDRVVFRSIMFSEIWEDMNLPNYYILHDGVHQNFLLFDKAYGKILPFTLHDIISTAELNTVLGRHHGKLFKFDFCKLRYNASLFNHELVLSDDYDFNQNIIIDEYMNGIEDISSINEAELNNLLPRLIIPIKTNMPYLQIPLATFDSFFSDLVNVSTAYNIGVDSNNLNSESDLPF